jgi:hypothetical protein
MATGWKGESKRHSIARKYGKASSKKTSLSKMSSTSFVNPQVRTAKLEETLQWKRFIELLTEYNILQSVIERELGATEPEDVMDEYPPERDKLETLKYRVEDAGSTKMILKLYDRWDNDKLTEKDIAYLKKHLPAMEHKLSSLQRRLDRMSDVIDTDDSEFREGE